MKLRLLLWDDCLRKCKGCCNKEWDLNSLPICTSFEGFEEIILTGGEPMLYPQTILEVIDIIRRKTKTPIYLYTSDVSNIEMTLKILSRIEGITLTLHTQRDSFSLYPLNKSLLAIKCFDEAFNKSLRLNVFKGIWLNKTNLSLWKIKDNMVWIKKCPLPKDEVFMKMNPSSVLGKK